METTNNNVVSLHTKHTKVVPFELKNLGEDTFEFEGYGSIFGSKDSYGDVVEPGAFAKTLADCQPKDIKMLYQHDPHQPIGVYKQMYEDSKGLFVAGKMAATDVPKAREAYALMKMGALSGLSIGYMINPGGYKYDPKENTLHLTSLKLMEVSVVTFPANERAQISAVKNLTEKELDDLMGNVRRFENFLRDVGGYSKSEAKYIAHRCFQVPLRDVEQQGESEDEVKLILNTLDSSIEEIKKLRGI